MEWARTNLRDRMDSCGGCARGGPPPAAGPRHRSALPRPGPGLHRGAHVRVEPRHVQLLRTLPLRRRHERGVDHALRAVPGAPVGTRGVPALHTGRQRPLRRGHLRRRRLPLLPLPDRSLAVLRLWRIRRGSRRLRGGDEAAPPRQRAPRPLPAPPRQASAGAAAGARVRDGAVLWLRAALHLLRGPLLVDLPPLLPKEGRHGGGPQRRVRVLHPAARADAGPCHAPGERGVEGAGPVQVLPQGPQPLGRAAIRPGRGESRVRGTGGARQGQHLRFGEEAGAGDASHRRADGPKGAARSWQRPARPPDQAAAPRPRPRGLLSRADHTRASLFLYSSAGTGH